MHYVPLTSIFSTRVISGAKSTSDLDTLLERRQAGRMYSSVEYERMNQTMFSCLFRSKCSYALGNIEYEFKLSNSR